MKFRFLRKLVIPLRATPFHPQWLIFRHEKAERAEIGRVAKGFLLDIGAGRQEIRSELHPGVKYVALDYYDTSVHWYETKPNIFGDGQHLPIAGDRFDTVLLLDVLEHLPDPEKCLREIQRILKPGGTLFLQVPFLYPLHDVPLDFYRWTLFGLRRLALRNGFSIVSEKMLGRPIETAVQLSNLAIIHTVLNWARSKNPLSLFGLLIPVVILISNIIAWIFSILPHDKEGFMPQSHNVQWKKQA